MKSKFKVEYQYIEVECMCPCDNAAARSFRVELHMQLKTGVWTTRQTVIYAPWDAPLYVVGRLAHEAMRKPPTRRFPWRAQANRYTQVFLKDSNEFIYDPSLRDNALDWEKNHARKESNRNTLFFQELLEAAYNIYVEESKAMIGDRLAADIMSFDEFSEHAVGEHNCVHFCICDGNEECDVEYYASPDELLLVAHTPDGKCYRAVKFDSAEEMLNIIGGLVPNELYALVELGGDAEESGLWRGKPIIRYV